jgi:hypothetical protein
MPRNVFTPQSIGPELLRTDKRIQQAAIRGLRLAARLGRGEIVKEIRGNKPFPVVDLGELLRSPKVTSMPDGALLDITAPHGTYQEFGTGPAAGNATFTPPLDAIFEWAMRKTRIQFKKKPKKKPKKGSPSPAPKKPRGPEWPMPTSPEDELKQRTAKRQRRAKAKARRKAAKKAREAAISKAARKMAGAVWTSIRRKGVKPKRFYQRASEKFGDHVEKMVGRQVAKVRD